MSQKGETEGKRVERDGNNYVKYIWEQVKRAMVENAREVCGSVRVGERTQRIRWNDKKKAPVRRKEVA